MEKCSSIKAYNNSSAKENEEAPMQEMDNPVQRGAMIFQFPAGMMPQGGCPPSVPQMPAGRMITPGMMMGGGCAGQMPQSQQLAMVQPQMTPAMPTSMPDVANDAHQYRQLFDSVVKVFCTSCSAEPFKPWQETDQEMATATGFIVSYGNNLQGIITNAHAVSDAVDVKVKLHGLPKKYTAKVRCIAHELDLALLIVDPVEDNRDFFQFAQGKSVPLNTDLPAMLSEVVVVGYPTGGQALSSTKGVVNRIGVVKYAHGKKPGLVIQIDAAINHGNSGGPTICCGQVVGVAFQGRGNAQVIGYIIPSSVVKFFLGQVAQGLRRVLYYEADFRYIQIDNKCLSEFFGMEKDQTGILVTKVPDGNKKNSLQKWDVILGVDGFPIANDGTIKIERGERVAWQRVFQTKSFKDAICKFQILRGSQPGLIDQKLNANSDIAPRHLYDRKSSYFMFGGCVFVPLSVPYLQNSLGSNISSEIHELETRMKSNPEEEIIILSQVLACKVADGYQTHSDLILQKVNNVEVKSMKHLIQVVCSARRYVLFEFKDNVVIVLDHQKAKQEEAAICAQNKIGSVFYLDNFNRDCCSQTSQVMTVQPPHASAQHGQVAVNCGGCKSLLGLVKLLAPQLGIRGGNPMMMMMSRGGNPTAPTPQPQRAQMQPQPAQVQPQPQPSHSAEFSMASLMDALGGSGGNSQMQTQPSPMQPVMINQAQRQPQPSASIRMRAMPVQTNIRYVMRPFGQ